MMEKIFVDFKSCSWGVCEYQLDVRVEILKKDVKLITCKVMINPKTHPFWVIRGDSNLIFELTLTKMLV